VRPGAFERDGARQCRLQPYCDRRRYIFDSKPTFTMSGQWPRRGPLMLARATQLIKNPIDLARHDKIVLVQALDLLGSQRDCRVTPAEVDIRVMAFGFSQVTYVSNETKRFLKIAKAESFDTVVVIAQFAEPGKPG
jgi:hypothetical protein